jgi:phage terminase large subunit
MSVAEFPEKLEFLFKPKRYKVLYGGRGGAKSWGIARALLILGRAKPLRILCAREIQKSIKDSVHKLLEDQIKELGFSDFYTVQNNEIFGRPDKDDKRTEFTFAGLKQNINNLKSFEGCDIVWIEEAHTVSKESWDKLIPTIRKEGSEIWVSFNPELDTDETYKRLVINQDKLPDAAVVKINWSDNPFFPKVMRDEMNALRAKSEDEYEHIYEGMCKQVVEGAIYRAELLAADKEGRIMRVPYDPTKPVDTFWDLGYADNTSIWLAQAVGFEFRLIDFINGSQQGLQYYLKALQEKGYVYGTDYLPHDAKAHQLGSGRSIEEMIRAAGRKVIVNPRLSIEDGIAAARAIFPKCYFDAEKTADGLQALRHYRYETDDKLQTLKKQPLHDWASHPADAFRTFAVAIREPQRQQEEMRDHVNPYGEYGWMA